MESTALFEKIDPAQPVAGWVGGKHRLAHYILNRQKQIPHVCYVEPFVGLGGVFLRRNFRSKCEIINDYDSDISTLFRVLQRHESALRDLMTWQLASRNEFERLRQTNPTTLTDLERAVRFIYMQLLVFGGKPNDVFGVSRTERSRFNLNKVFQRIRAAHARLLTVTIECMPWQAVIARYDTPDTLFYLDPPYYGIRNHYNIAFGSDEFAEMADILHDIKGHFILSLNDCPQVRTLFTGFDIETVSTSYSLALKASSRGQRAELLISN